MTITAKIVADSVSVAGSRITTLELRYPRFIHAEFMTHRVFSRNASSSRAIPVERLIADVMSDPAMPLHWGKNQPGMQAREEHDYPIHFQKQGTNHWYEEPPAGGWLEARDRAVDMARAFSRAGYHKQIVNRLLEPFSHINVVVTATDWSNFFDLRIHEDAQPEIRVLAEAIKAAREGSHPRHMGHRRWHLPYGPDYLCSLEEAKLISAARCARVSYKTHDGRESGRAEDVALAERLRDSRHMSPFEHQVTPASGRHANFNGWTSFRQEIER